MNAPRGKTLAQRPKASRPKPAACAWRHRDGLREREARQAAGAFVLGEHELGRRLTPAAPAVLTVPGSVGMPLPVELRLSLESAFGADLSPVRLHADASANAIARAFGARAFAAGTRGFFREGLLSFGDVEGRRLIAHEVAHMIQQTGRPGSGGRIRLEAHAAGDGPVQRDDDRNAKAEAAREKLSGGLEIGGRFAEFDLLAPKTGIDACIEVTATYRKLPTEAAISAAVDAVLTAMIGKSDYGARVGVKEQFDKLKPETVSDDLRAFYADCLKALGGDKEASEVLGKLAPVRTAFASWAFYDKHLRGDGSWVMDELKRHDLGARTFPGMVVAVARVDFWGLARTGQDLDPQGQFSTKISNAIADALLYDPLAGSERTAVALRALAAFDTLRQLPFKEIEEQVQGNHALSQRYGHKRMLIRSYRDEKTLPDLAKRNGVEPEVLALAVAAGKAIAPVAAQADEFWDAVELAAGLATKQDQTAAAIDRDDLMRQVRERLPSIKVLKQLEPDLIAAVKLALAPEAGGMPSAKRLQINLAAAARAIRGITFRIDGALAQRGRKLDVAQIATAEAPSDAVQAAAPAVDPAAPKPKIKLAVTDDMAIGIVLLRLYALHERLRNFEADKAAEAFDKAYAEEHVNDAEAPDPKDRAFARSVALRDEAGLGFVKAGGQFGDFADDFGLSALSQAARQWKWLQEKEATKSFVALYADFEEAPATLHEFAEAFPSESITGFPVEGREIVTLVYALYYEDLLGRLQARLKEREFVYQHEKIADNVEVALASGAVKEANEAIKPPQRFKVPRESTLLLVLDKDRDRVNDLLEFDAGKGIRREHPRFAKLLKQFDSQKVAITPRQLSAHQDGYVTWIVDHLDRMAERLAKVDGVVWLESPTGGFLGQPKDFPGGAIAWLSALGKATEVTPEMRKKAEKDAKIRALVEDRDALRAEMKGSVDAWMNAAKAALDAPMHRATNNERRIAGPQMAAQWERVKRSFLADPEAFYAAPREAMQLLNRFIMEVRPFTPEERQLQIAALMLELTPVLIRKFGSEERLGGLFATSSTDRFDIILPLHSFVDMAARFAMKPENLKRLQEVTADRTLNLEFDPADIPRRARQLQFLAGEFVKTAKSHQQETVLEGLPGPNMVRVPGRPYPLYGVDPKSQEPGEAFMLEGVVYQLIKVHAAFRYEPEMQAQATLAEGDHEQIGTRNLWVDGKAVSAKDSPVDLITIVRSESFREGAQPQEILIRSNDTKTLTELTYALDIHNTMESLGVLADVLTEFAGALTAVIQLAFPEFAPEIAAAEIAGSILQFWGSAEFQTIKAMLQEGDLKGLFSKGLDELKKEFSPDNLWDYLLFGNEPPMLAALLEGLEVAGRFAVVRSARGDDVKKGSIDKVLKPLLRASGTVAKGVENVHDHTSFAFRKMELWVQGSPWAALIMRVIANAFHRLEGLSLKELLIEEFSEGADQVRGIYRKFEAVLDKLNNFVLPAELVPLEAILEMVLNFIIDHLPFKYRKPMQGVRAVVNASPLRKLYDKLLEVVAKKLRDEQIDPNLIWQNYIKPEIEPYLRQAGKLVSDEIHDKIQQVPFLKGLTEFKQLTVKMNFAGEDAAPRLEDDRAAPLASPRLPVGPGRRLAPGERGAAQRGFGHDFAHVRVHRGAAVDSSLRVAGARAATSGSHVYLDSRVRTERADGRAVLHHELAHVLQQAGPRPLGARHSPEPTGQSAAPGGGEWLIESASERQADRLAEAAQVPADAPRPVDAANGGVQPSLERVVEKFFKKLGDPTALIENAEQLAHPGALKERPKAAEIDAGAPMVRLELAQLLKSELEKARTSSKVVSFSTPFDAAQKEIVDYILSNRADTFDEIAKILPFAFEKVKLPKDKQEKGAPPKEAWVLDPKRLETLLEEFFFGRTSVSVDVEFNLEAFTAPDGRKRNDGKIDMTNPFKKLAVNYVHLPMIGGTSIIWDKVMHDNYPSFTGTRKQIYQAKARLALQGLQPGPFLFDKTPGAKALKFSAKLLALIESYANPPAKSGLPGDDAPTWVDYAKPDGAQHPKFGQIGLRLGHYGEKEDPSKQKGTERQSHHTVQYVLVEYLDNNKDTHQPFPHALSLYPNIVAAGGAVAMITKSPGANSGIRVSEHVGEKRGPEMPTILLSAHTHMLGGVHISPQPDDITNASSQGAAVHTRFNSMLGSYRNLVRNRDALAALKKKESGTGTLTPKEKSDLPGAITREELGEGIYRAACKLYTWMREDMNTRLQAALDKHEIDYYNALVATASNQLIFANGKAKPNYIPKSAGKAIMDAVKQRQKDTLEGPNFGFEERH